MSSAFASSAPHGHARFGALALFIVGNATLAPAAISIDSDDEVYSEHFDSLRNTSFGSWSDDSTLTGWYSSRAGISAYPFNVGFPLVSFGLGSSSERALGFSGIGSETSVAFGVNLINNTGSLLRAVTVSYFGEKWYANLNPGAYTGGLEFSFGTGVTPGVGTTTTTVPALDFDPPGNVVIGSDGNLFLNGDNYHYLDGNHADYRTFISHTFLIGGGGWLPGENLMLVWQGGEYGAGASDGLAIDDLSIRFSTTAIPEPATAGTLAALAAAGAVVGTRRRRRG